jgi:hypothetical protein
MTLSLRHPRSLASVYGGLGHYRSHFNFRFPQWVSLRPVAAPASPVPLFGWVGPRPASGAANGRERSGAPDCVATNPPDGGNR